MSIAAASMKLLKVSAVKELMEFATIYTEFYKVLLSFTKSKVNSHEDAENILQNVFIKIATCVNDLRKTPQLDICYRNSIIDYYRLNANKKNWLLKMIFRIVLQMKSTMILPKGWIAA